MVFNLHSFPRKAIVMTKTVKKKKVSKAKDNGQVTNEIIVPFPRKTMLVCQDEEGKTVLKIDLLYANFGITKVISFRKDTGLEIKSNEWVVDYAQWLSTIAGEEINFTQAMNLTFAISDGMAVLKKKSLLQRNLLSGIK